MTKMAMTKMAMTKMATLKLAASTLVIGTMMVGAISGQAAPAALTDSARVATVAAANAAHALARRQGVLAVTFAEAAVAASPREANYRMLLGQAYLAAGRFQSAGTAFSDTLMLDPNRERAALNLALVQTALGKAAAARATLAQYRERLGAADFGLASALAGDVREGVRVLEFAARAPDADAKTRQNLALAYALDGQWANAKVLALQDLAPAEADIRLVQWASFAKPKGSWDQVASLLDVRPAADSGQPAQLALNIAPSPTQVAQVAAPQPPAPVDDPVAVAMAISAATPAPAVGSAATPSAAVAIPAADEPAFEIAFAQHPRTAAATRSVPVVRSAPIAKATPARTPAPRRVAANSMRPVLSGSETGRFVVQLGAFANHATAERAWGKAVGHFSLASFAPVNGTARLRSMTLVRLSIGGFDNRVDAQRICGKIRATGGKCFVRPAQNDAPALWAQRAKPVRVAAN